MDWHVLSTMGGRGGGGDWISKSILVCYPEKGLKYDHLKSKIFIFENFFSILLLRTSALERLCDVQYIILGVSSDY